MIPAPFEYHRANSLREAIDLLSKLGPDAKLLAGGHSLLPAMKLRLSRPSHLVDISHLKELRYIREEGNTIIIGALTPHVMVAASELVNQKAPVLAQAAGCIGDVQVRNKGTIGGSLAHADPAADYPAAVLAADAEIVAEGPNGRRSIRATDFFLGFFTTALQPDEVLREVRVPVQPATARSAYLKFPHPASGYAVAGCGAWVDLDGGVCREARVAFTGVSGNAFRDKTVEDALTGQPLNEATIKAAAEKAAEGVEPLSDTFASGDYRRHLAKVYARRALMQVAA